MGFLSAVTVGLIAGIYEAGMQLGDLGELLGDIVASSPELVAGVVTGIFGALGISGVVDIGTHTYVGLTFVVLGAGWIIASRKGAGA
ncbi:hypothetical protein [Haloprofundus sp. MHR1]|uniref:hypothetical protein n=1 Tax=Haloprofundus sp. MHR1 TaxID=2572921 RepID=UPI0010BE5B3C|nr:hypothetical protein [Haloprofundus sp. MHR1]QCJ47249.1 hypothetical protein FCF25_09025 [Haloprofundus sp. MHR1]